MNSRFQYPPLYKQVYKTILSRISEGYWKPGQSLPSEHALGVELGVSQGTVRKALNVLEAENIVIRRQGMGTFVSEHTTEASLYRFFRLTPRNGERLTPSSELLSIRKRVGSALELEMLQSVENSTVIEMKRKRLVEGSGCIAEDIILPFDMFNDIDAIESLPGSLYPFYQRHFGVHIVSVSEKLSAASADEELADRLDVGIGTPLLKVERSALTIDQKSVEWRTSYIETSKFVYSIDLS